MGQAKRRGTFEERKAQAIARRAELTEEYRKNMQDPTAELPKFRLPHGRRHLRSFTEEVLVAAMAGIGSFPSLRGSMRKLRA